MEQKLLTDKIKECKMKNKTTAIIICLFLGGFGIHRGRRCKNN